jgi:hypothetical protein
MGGRAAGCALDFPPPRSGGPMIAGRFNARIEMIAGRFNARIQMVAGRFNARIEDAGGFMRRVSDA